MEDLEGAREELEATKVRINSSSFFCVSHGRCIPFCEGLGQVYSFK